MTDNAIKGFYGNYNFLSNFYKHEAVTYDGMTAKTVEHLFQAVKTLDPKERKKILEAETPGDAKRLGQKVTLRADWESEKIYLMLNILLVKFAIPRLRKKLLATGDAYLEETNDWGDHFWGANKKGYGKNVLGRLLMNVRRIVRNGRNEMA